MATKAPIRLVATSNPRKGIRTRQTKKIARKANKPTRTKLIKEADALMSKWVRLSRADEDGFVDCFTCDHSGHYKKMQNGHWIVRQYKYTRWDEDNTRPQCYACNFLFNGRPHIFRENLVDEIGEERVKALEARAKPLFKERDDFIQDIITVYSNKLELL